MKTVNAPAPSGKHKTTVSRTKTNKASNSVSMKSSQLMKLFDNELRDIYWAEKALNKAIPKMIRNTTSTELADALTNHLAETKAQIIRIEQVFESVEKKASGKKCEATQGLINEAETIMEDCEEGPMCDAGIISAAQKIAHYKIATYGTLKQFAETLGLVKASGLLNLNLNEVKAADKKLTEVAVKAINTEASELVV